GFTFANGFGSAAGAAGTRSRSARSGLRMGVTVEAGRVGGSEPSLTRRGTPGKERASTLRREAVSYSGCHGRRVGPRALFAPAPAGTPPVGPTSGPGL